MLKWKVPVSIITGYLGSGKTTLLKKIIDDTDRKIAVLMNEFGEIGVDTKVVKGKDVDIMEMLGGCVCCSLTGELNGAIAEILDRVGPDMIVIETTGVAEPDALITNLDGLKGVRLDSVITVVDADAVVKFPNMGHTGIVQIECADVILLNKIDLVSADQMAAIEDAIARMNPRARIFRTAYSNLDTRVLFGLEVERSIRPHEEHDVSDIDSFVYKSMMSHDRASFVKFVEGMPKGVYRSKGHINFPTGLHFFNFVNGRYDLEKTDMMDDTQIVFIGHGINREKEAILRGISSCQI